LATVPSENHNSWGDYIRSIIPGLLFCIILGAIALWIDANIVPDELFIVNYVLVAILLGLVVKNILPGLKLLEPGIAFSARICLYIGVVLLGAGLNLFQIFQVGANAIVMVAISITLCIGICGWLGKKLFNNERWGHLVGTGIGVCGVSAVMALAPAIQAKEREIIAAISAALLTDILVLIALPTIGHPLNWSDTLAGYLAGIVPSNTAQCIAIGYAYSDAAGVIATIVKSARNAFMPIVILVLTFIYTRRGLPVGQKVGAYLLWSKFPKFIFGLMLAATIGTMGLISAEGIALASTLSKWFFVVCFVGIGASVDIKLLGNQDLAVISFGFLMTIILGVFAYLYSTAILML